MLNDLRDTFGFKIPEIFPGGGTPPTPSPVFSPEYQVVYDAMTNKPSDAIAIAQDAMVVSLVGAGYWARMYLFYCFAQESNAANEADINWINPGTNNCTEAGVGALIFTSLEGYTGDGTNYLTTGWNPNIAGLALNSATIGIYIRNDINSTNFVMAVDAGADELSILTRTGGLVYGKVNAALAITLGGVATSVGHWMVTRTGAVLTEMYTNGISVDSETDVSTNVPNDNLYFLAKDGANPSTHQISIGYVLDGISDGEATAIHNIIETYMDSNGKGIAP